MKERVVNTGGGGISFFGMLAILFIGLKLTGYVSWSWWWVLSPLWGPAVILLGICMIAVVAMGICILFDRLLKRV